MKKYSVLLEYPSLEDTFFTWVEAETPAAAATIARAEAQARNTDEDDGTIYRRAEDFTLLGVFAGHIEMEYGIWDDKE